MVEHIKNNLDATFSALADPTRRAIMARLVERDLTVSEVAKPYDMSLAAVSKHIHILSRANLISLHKEGRIRRCHLEPDTLRQAASWIDHYKQFWTGVLESLDDYIETNPGAERSREPTSKEE